MNPKKRGRPKKITTQTAIVNFPAYRATIKVAGRTCIAGGSTIQDAILGLTVPNAKGKGILTIENNNRKAEKVLQPALISRLFNTRGIYKEIVVKNICTIFGGI